MLRRLAAPLLALCLSAELAAGQELAAAQDLDGQLAVLDEAPEDNQLRGTSRRLFNWASTEGYIWGRCDNWTEATTGCNLTQGYTCRHGLSDGPEDATIEITLGNLPASTSEMDVHVQWWSPRESIYPYEPLESPLGGAIYWFMSDAYPRHDEDAFNGGNVRVDENGKATIKVRPPATYRVANWIAAPHIHLRICQGDLYAHATPDAVYFTFGGTYITTGSLETFNLTIDSTRLLTTTSTTTTTLLSLHGAVRFQARLVDEAMVIGSVSGALQDALGVAFVGAAVEVAGSRRLSDGEWTVSYVVQVSELQTDATRGAVDSIRSNDASFSSLLRTKLVEAGAEEGTLDFDLREVKELEVATTATMTSTTTTTSTETTTSTTATTTTRTYTTRTTTARTATATTTTTPAPFTWEVINGEARTVVGQINPVDLRIQNALDILDLDALEFSPVYRCLMDGRFYDYFSSGCSDDCPDRADVHVGQCVSKNISAQHVKLQVAWKLLVQCGVHCLHSKINATLHHLRIAVADHMDIPFQEVGLQLHFPEVEARRLQEMDVPKRNAFLVVNLESRRLDKRHDKLLLGRFLNGAASTGWLLGMNVWSVERVLHGDIKDIPGALSGALSRNCDKDSDRYEPAYMAPGRSKDRTKEAIYGLPGTEFLPTEAVLALAGSTAIILGASVAYMHRRRQQSMLLQLQEVTGKQVELKEEALQEMDPSSPRKVAWSPTNEAVVPAYPDFGTPASPTGSTGFNEAAAAPVTTTEL